MKAGKGVPTNMSHGWSYQETIAYLCALQKHGIKLALSNSRALMGVLGDPHRKFPTVHIAGTNGKGSTAAFIAGVLQEAGYRVGLYTSPHLIDFTERIRINNVSIPETAVVKLARQVYEGYRSFGDGDGSETLNPTFFEVTTALAFSYFAEEEIDIGVIETGMGGRFDSTNVITPLVSVITNIDLEHREFLGNTLGQIAAEKAGIIKAGVPVVSGVVQPEVIGVIKRAAAEQQSPVYHLGSDFMPKNITSGRKQVFDYQGFAGCYSGVRIAMLGAHQVDNACLAMAAVECLRNAGICVEESALRRGLEKTRWAGRMEKVADRPDIYLDGAHNPASARKLADLVKVIRADYSRAILVIGILSDKDYLGIISELAPLFDHVIVTKPEYSRAMNTALLASEMKKLHGSVDRAETIESALAKAKTTALPKDLILVAGSLYVVGEARALFASVLSDTGRTGVFSGLKG
jgi:dihydrofolate synthase / folylpolyglutamate synthase